MKIPPQRWWAVFVMDRATRTLSSLEAYPTLAAAMERYREVLVEHGWDSITRFEMHHEAECDHRECPIVNVVRVYLGGREAFEFAEINRKENR